MNSSDFSLFNRIFSNCRRAMKEKTWGAALAALDEDCPPQQFPDYLLFIKSRLVFPDFVADLARLEWEYWKASQDESEISRPASEMTVNPTLSIIPVSWSNLAAIINGRSGNGPPPPESQQKHVMIWRSGNTGETFIGEAEDSDLLALKIAVEKIDPRTAAETGNVKAGLIHAAIERAVAREILLSPLSRIQREFPSSRKPSQSLEAYLSTDVFTLQWHITQACDLHCKHCYDRSNRKPMPFDEAIEILDDFYDFCRQMHVRGQVTFTGGNPLLYPRFEELYRAADHRGFAVAILGNPTPMEKMEELVEIAKPVFFQISLEGLEEHNDAVRGKGHFRKSLKFLGELKSLDIFSMVMLTLTRDNCGQVLPLAELLETRADYFTFNRLCTVGEGADLALPAKDHFETFLRDYVAASRKSVVMGLKDNLINIIREQNGEEPFGGCTGYGCGAAFNFVSLLSDGEVHACRKFPSQIGNIRQKSLMDIYHSDLAKTYRKGPQACMGCDLSPVCRGCLASAYSHGLNVFEDKDPFCFFIQ